MVQIKACTHKTKTVKKTMEMYSSVQRTTERFSKLPHIFPSFNPYFLSILCVVSNDLVKISKRYACSRCHTYNRLEVSVIELSFKNSLLKKGYNTSSSWCSSRIL